MDVATGASVVVAAVGVIAGTAGILEGRRKAKRDLHRLREADALTTKALDEQRVAAVEARRVRDRILASMQDGVLLFDGEQRTVFANDALGRLLGSRPEGLGQLLPARLRETVRRASLAGTAQIDEMEVGTPARWLRATATPAGDDGSVLVAISDVTEARRLDAVRRDFVANASHELKTPAASIQAAAETLLHVWQDDPAAIPRFAEQLEREALRLSRIVADLLDLSRLESGSELEDQVRMDALLREECSRFQEAAVQVGLTLDLELEPVPPVRGSGRDLSLLVRNLLDNAIRYSKPHGSVRASISAEDGSLVLRVADTGTGIPSKELTRVFERFYRVDRARSRETGGTGLGLAIVRHVAENHGGSVTVKSELGTGSTFEVRLPVTTNGDSPG